MNVLLPKQFNVDKIKYSEMKVMKSGAKSVYVNYIGSKVNIQTPVLNIPYGVNDNMQFIKDDPKSIETQKYDITVSFKGIDENPKIKTFHDKFIELENKIMEDAFTNRVAWFKNNFDGNKGTVSNMFSRIIRRDKDKETGMYADKYPPTFKAKIPYNSLEDKFDDSCKSNGSLFKIICDLCLEIIKYTCKNFNKNQFNSESDIDNFIENNKFLYETIYDLIDLLSPINDYINKRIVSYSFLKSIEINKNLQNIKIENQDDLKQKNISFTSRK